MSPRHVDPTSVCNGFPLRVCRVIGATPTPVRYAPVCSSTQDR
ncbi:hypothetical protein HNR68_001667 [Saccharopolyspora hordei]|uniref:Uncharacterized protein n=1 Tax=Saccharopolyspora hordei TaxID=1838 RepID=A0A853AQP7_9PSEU|nr:hypothetical protein [Saccharopolyspora hordei]